MAIFQHSVLNKYQKALDKELIDAAYDVYSKYFHNEEIQRNIRESKEEQYQEGFLRELFVKVLGYTLNPSPDYDLTTEYKNEKGAKKADGAILEAGKAIAVIELKSTKTKDLEKVRQQAFDYKSNHTDCVYVVTSNFEKLRFYIDNAVDFEEFNLFTLNKEEFALLYLCLSADNLMGGLPLKIKSESIAEEESITKNFYSDYSDFKKDLFRDLVKNNLRKPSINHALYDESGEASSDSLELSLFKKSQKLIDRFLFIFFSEDRGLLAPNTTLGILNDWQKLIELDVDTPLYDRFKLFFKFLDIGRAGTNKKDEVFAYNGGLFKEDALLDSLVISDGLLLEHAKRLSNYDFESQIDVNILGHIFENSLNEDEIVSAEILGAQFDKKKAKRKREGVFYTPKYVTTFIVENTIGLLCEEQKTLLGIREYEYQKAVKGRRKSTLKALKETLDSYRDWLLQVTICDPACGSGAFLNRALDFLITEHRYIDELEASLFGGGLVFRNIEDTILENNIYGVDINEESVEIAKLSLWLRTAQPRRKLSDLSSNIKCGNSLCSEESVAGAKAFDWEKEFPDVCAAGGFDVVIGNPPYGAYQSKEEKEFNARTFSTFQGNHEIYFFFIEMVARLLKKSGYIGFITPDTWIKIPQAQKLRAHVLSEYGIDKIVAFEYPVFEDASVNALIFTAARSVAIKECTVTLADSAEKKLTVSNANIRKCLVNNWIDSEDKQFQIWQDAGDIKLLKKLRKNSQPGSAFVDVCQGIVPYSTENLTKEEVKKRIYHSAAKNGATWGEWVQGRAIRRYGLDNSNAEFLNYGEWLHRPRKAKYFSGERILIQEITGGKPPRISATIYRDTLYHDPGIISCLNISDVSAEYLLSVINSRLISWYVVKSTPKGKRKTFPKLLIGDIRSLPIKAPDQKTQSAVHAIVKRRMDLADQVISKSNLFLKYVRSSLALQGLSKKLSSWADLSFVDFNRELVRQLKKVGRPPLSKVDEIGWMELFDKRRVEILEANAEILELDREIDSIIYKVYDLDDDDIALIEAE